MPLGPPAGGVSESSLNETFGRDGVTFTEGSAGTKAILTAGGAKLEVFLFGAHTISWQVGGKERLWMSSLSKVDGSAPIRGGVPIAWPQFATQGPLPLHGFARVSTWAVLATHHGQPGNGTAITLGLSENKTAQAWAHKFELEYTITLTPTAVAFELAVVNTDSEAWEFTGCLHTYLRWQDSAAVSVKGLGGVSYLDKCDGSKEKVEAGAEMTAPGAATESGAAAGKPGYLDRIYLGTPDELTVSEGGAPVLTVQQSPSWPDTSKSSLPLSPVCLPLFGFVRLPLLHFHVMLLTTNFALRYIPYGCSHVQPVARRQAGRGRPGL
eukprot:SAG22_NODE_903_length_6590_cov_2.976121_3_plen_324_part_00